MAGNLDTIQKKVEDNEKERINLLKQATVYRTKINDSVGEKSKAPRAPAKA